jgi:hypothetical protein
MGTKGGTRPLRATSYFARPGFSGFVRVGLVSFMPRNAHSTTMFLMLRPRLARGEQPSPTLVQRSVG